jgi:hypothetical protein
MTIHIPEDLESSFLAAVRRGRYASLDQAMDEAASLLVQRLDQEQAAPAQATGHVPPAPAYRPIWEVADTLRQSVPPQEWARVPADGSAQHDHYIYGTPKRPAS